MKFIDVEGIEAMFITMDKTELKNALNAIAILLKRNLEIMKDDSSVEMLLEYAETFAVYAIAQDLYSKLGQ
ncbi:MAG: hypothetical protein KQ78_01783 [Candidatus Izimaplasma bacterium HR2]|nr:MAG: hypothetical protein KQ78_01783 [Candidatus Izimaplasma bacterium HR2]